LLPIWKLEPSGGMYSQARCVIDCSYHAEPSHILMVILSLIISKFFNKVKIFLYSLGEKHMSDQHKDIIGYKNKILNKL